MVSKDHITVTIDLHKLGKRLVDSDRVFIRVHELSLELGISISAAGKVLSALEKLGYLVKWSKGLYIVRRKSLLKW
ncbi:MAG: hypothetical protein DRO40_01835 [Thermoprotei archaeon]|nr:MAG: hypothetical protein DRO40_01835 [Thermoprotei archaeon]